MSRWIWTALCAILALASCQKSAPYDDPSSDMRREFVTVKHVSGNGDARFELQERDDSPKYLLHAKGADPKTLTDNRRVVIDYYETSRVSDTERMIAVRNYVSTFSDSIRAASLEKIQEHKNNPIQLTSMWRSGEFVNVSCLVQYTGKRRLEELVIDNATINSETVEAYLIDDLLGVEGAFYRKLYASYNIAAVWKRPSAKCLRIYVSDMNHPNVKYIEFIKPN